MPSWPKGFCAQGHIAQQAEAPAALFARSRSCLRAWANNAMPSHARKASFFCPLYPKLLGQQFQYYPRFQNMMRVNKERKGLPGCAAGCLACEVAAISLA